MTYKELKPLLADRVSEITLVSGVNSIAVYNLRNLAGEELLLNDILENDPISDLENFEVKHIYSAPAGFILEFEYSLDISRAIGNNANLKLVEFINE